MFEAFIEALREIFTTPSVYTNVEAYIVAGNPQTPDDVDRLEREFYRKQSRNMTSYDYYH